MQILPSFITDVCRQYEPGSRMILDAILLSLVKIVSNVQSKTDVAIFPEMRLAPTGGIQVINPDSGYEVWLSGSVDYAVVQYEDVLDNKGRSYCFIMLL